MKYTFLSVVLTATLAATACSPKTADAEAGAAPMPVPEAAADVTADMAAPAAEQNDVVDLAIGSPDHTTLVSAVRAAGLVDTLKSAGPFTVFAPVNAAFDALPAGTVDTLLKPESKGDLTTVLTYHVVAGNVDAAALTQQIEAGGGTATLKTVQGGELKAQLADGGVTLTDAKGNTAKVTTADLKATNGVIHVVDKVLMP
ncbi:fasciclin domain-containing protein [Pseudoxanthomonas sp. PXM03]|uniref:fasciclin domain-containing protein n=1 Tax=Pseudoxanthomonas sp. PXM03 TaxID=2769284 RepID=UPI00177C9EA4|nr:fasciclin domain-containing protein [Pseudoxanthomonas sp. PXM03]MBD9437746.1 fasciclin domain-containing protein [Pseudoxanthomonas sp. PXM03]